VGPESAFCAQCHPSRRCRMLTVLSTQPGVGAPARRGRVKGLRRVNLSRVRYYIYYRVSEGFLDVLAFWHTSRDAQPRV